MEEIIMYNKNKLLFLFLISFGINLSATDGAQLLSHWKSLINEKKLEYNQKAFDGISGDYEQEQFERLKSADKLDHIRITYHDADGYHKVYLQLEQSRYHHFLHLFATTYFYNENKVLKKLEDLMKILPANVEPVVDIYPS